jgi:hypothetical protein
MGRLRLGVGSALDEKYLLRVEGPTSDPKDDLILEAKEARDLTGIDCILPTKRGDAFRVLVAQARISYNPYPHVGYIVIHPRRGDTRDRTFWVRQWSDNYHELSVDDSFQRFQDLREVAFDVGVQLGLGHPTQIADPHEDLLRRSLLASLDEFEGDVVHIARELSAATMAAWRTVAGVDNT